VKSEGPSIAVSKLVSCEDFGRELDRMPTETLRRLGADRVSLKYGTQVQKLNTSIARMRTNGASALFSDKKPIPEIFCRLS
jgi:hypothetical protein